MDQNFETVCANLLDLISRIQKGEYPHKSRSWVGADVVITSKAPEPSNSQFYPEPRYVVTPFYRELSWLFTELRDIFAQLIDGATKIEFFGRLANMAIRYQKRLKRKPENEKDLLIAIIHEAFAILEEMAEGKFQYLGVAVGNTIFDDLVDRAEASGFLGLEETRNFFEEMERRYRDA